jgi:hypothetical protein
VQDQLSGLVELSMAHHQLSRVQVDVTAIQGNGFANPDAGHGQEADQRRECEPSHRRAQRVRGRDQRRDVGIGVQVRAGPAASLW